MEEKKDTNLAPSRAHYYPNYSTIWIIFGETRNKLNFKENLQ
jgi:hypothetical protein